MEMIRIKNLYKRYSDKVVYNDLNLDIEEGKITVLLGESGSGKTTLLNAIAGLTELKGEPRLCNLPLQQERFRYLQGR